MRKVGITLNQIRLGSAFVAHENRIYAREQSVTSPTQQDLAERSVWELTTNTCQVKVCKETKLMWENNPNRKKNNNSTTIIKTT